MSKKFLPYHVVRRGRGFEIYKRDDDKPNWSSTTSLFFSDYDKAYAESYRLNGEWMKNNNSKK